VPFEENGGIDFAIAGLHLNLNVEINGFIVSLMIDAIMLFRYM